MHLELSIRLEQLVAYIATYNLECRHCREQRVTLILLIASSQCTPRMTLQRQDFSKANDLFPTAELLLLHY